MLLCQVSLIILTENYNQEFKLTYKLNLTNSCFCSQKALWICKNNSDNSFKSVISGLATLRKNFSCWCLNFFLIKVKEIIFRINFIWMFWNYNIKPKWACNNFQWDLKLNLKLQSSIIAIYRRSRSTSQLGFEINSIMEWELQSTSVFQNRN